MTGDDHSLSVSMDVGEDDGRGTTIWEGLPDGFLLEIGGQATGRLNDGVIEASGSGALWYGNGLPAPTSYACQVDDLRLTFKRR